MAASDYGYYRSDGIQNSGTALRQNGNAYIYNSAGQIYPRQITETGKDILNDFESGVSYTCMTIRDSQAYVGSGDKQTWRDDALQGFIYSKSLPTWRSGRSVGHFFNPNGKASVGNNVIDFKVSYVKIQIGRGDSGRWSSQVTGHLRMSNLSSSFKNGEFRGMRWGDLDFNLVERYDYPFAWKPIGQVTILESNDPNSDLCRFMTNFYKETSAQTLCLYNGENSGNPYSANYAKCPNKEFKMQVKVDRTVQL